MDGSLGSARESQGNSLQDVGVGGQVDGFVSPVSGIQGVGHQEHHPVYWDLGPHDDGPVADVHGADPRRRSQEVCPLTVNRRRD